MFHGYVNLLNIAFFKLKQVILLLLDVDYALDGLHLFNPTVYFYLTNKQPKSSWEFSLLLLLDIL